MKTTVKTIALASIIVMGTASAFAKPAKGHGKNTQEKTVTTTTVTTTTTKTVKEEPKKVASKTHSKHDQKKEVSHGHRRDNDNRRRHVAQGPKHDSRPVEKHHASPAPVVKHETPKPTCGKGPAPVAVKEPCRPTAVVTKVEVERPVTVVKTVEVRPAAVELDGKSLAAGAIIGGILALTAVAAAN